MSNVLCLTDVSRRTLPLRQSAAGIEKGVAAGSGNRGGRRRFGKPSDSFDPLLVRPLTASIVHDEVGYVAWGCFESDVPPSDADQACERPTLDRHVKVERS